ncbi:MAG: YfiR family protein [Gemmatimonadota bacterium]
MALLTGAPTRWLVILLGVMLPGRALAQAVERPEYEVKSAYLVNFLLYATWPPDALAPDDALRLCILGENPLGDFLDEATTGRSIQGHAIRVIQVDRVVEADRCHAAFIAARNRIPAAVWLERLRGRAVLSIGEGEEFRRAGGMITLTVEDQTVRFEVNLRALRDVGLDLSSRVLRLARNREGG